MLSIHTNTHRLTYTCGMLCGQMCIIESCVQHDTNLPFYHVCSFIGYSAFCFFTLFLHQIFFSFHHRSIYSYLISIFRMVPNAFPTRSIYRPRAGIQICTDILSWIKTRIFFFVHWFAGCLFGCFVQSICSKWIYSVFGCKSMRSNGAYVWIKWMKMSWKKKYPVLTNV